MVMYSGTPRNKRILRQINQMSLKPQQSLPGTPGLYAWNGADWGFNQKPVPGWPRAGNSLSASSMMVSPQLKDALLARTNDPDLRDLIEAVEDARITSLYALRTDSDEPAFIRIWNEAMDELAPRQPQVSVTATGKAKAFVPYHTASGHTRH